MSISNYNFWTRTLGIVIFAIMVSVVVFIITPSVTHAQEYDPFGGTVDASGNGYDPFGGGYDPSGNGYDPFVGGYDPSGNSYDPFAGGYDPFAGGYDPFNGCTLDCGGYTNGCGFDCQDGLYDSALANGCDAYCVNGGYGYDEYSYYDDACKCYEYGYGGYGVGGHFAMPSYSSSGYSMVHPLTFSSPNYSTPARPVQGGNSSVTNTTVTNTNVDNSINGSFNNYNSGNTSVVSLGQAVPQYPVVYSTPTYTSPAPYCTINQAQASGSGITAAYLSWSSTNATSAYLSNVGSVATYGSQTVWPTTSATYVLTVYGANGQSAQCQVTVHGYSNPAPYVSLTQIPYTGFDFGMVGNAIYWAVLASFALAGGYLVYFYTGSTLSIASAMTKRTYAPVVAAKAPILLQKEAAQEKTANPPAGGVQPIVAAIRRGTMAGTTDSMAIVASKDGSMPKIVISRD